MTDYETVKAATETFRFALFFPCALLDGSLSAERVRGVVRVRGPRRRRVCHHRRHSPMAATQPPVGHRLGGTRACTPFVHADASRRGTTDGVTVRQAARFPAVRHRPHPGPCNRGRARRTDIAAVFASHRCSGRRRPIAAAYVSE